MQQNASSREHSESDLYHIAQTINMLYLAVCQIEATMSDASSSVNTLTESFTNVAAHAQGIQAEALNIESKEHMAQFNDALAKNTEEIQDSISRAVRAFQFYDRVCQRVDHVARSLEMVSEVLKDNDNLHKTERWENVQDQIKSSYTMEAERLMFEFIMRGGEVKEALEIYRHHFISQKDDSTDDEIELF